MEHFEFRVPQKTGCGTPAERRQLFAQKGAGAFAALKADDEDDPQAYEAAIAGAGASSAPTAYRAFCDLERRVCLHLSIGASTQYTSGSRSDDGCGKRREHTPATDEGRSGEYHEGVPQINRVGEFTQSTVDLRPTCRREDWWQAKEQQGRQRKTAGPPLLGQEPTPSDQQDYGSQEGEWRPRGSAPMRSLSRNDSMPSKKNINSAGKKRCCQG